MRDPAPTRSMANRYAFLAASFGFMAVIVSQSISEGGMNSWTSLPTWAAFAAFAALVTFAPWVAGSAAGRAAAWKAAAAGVAALWLVWVLFVLPSIHRNVAFLYTIGISASAWAVWNAPGRSPPPS